MPSRRVASQVWKLAVVLAATACSSCADDYLVRRDSLAFGEGDAVRADMTRQGIDPSPAVADLTVLDANGERLQHAMERYRNPSVAASGAAGAPLASTVPVLK